jgi:HlyD family secretion protein
MSPAPRPIACCLGALLLLACHGSDSDLRLVGTVERTLVELVAPTAEVIVEVGVERGQRVAPGQVLVRLDPTLAEAEIARAQARLAGAQTAVVVAQHELDRAIELRGRDVASQQKLDRAQLERSEAFARLHEAEALLAVARKRRRDLDLSAPVASVVDQIPFDPGERVPVGAVVAVVLAEGDPWVRVWIPEERFVQVVPGTRAEIRIDGLDGALEGRVLDVAREPEFSPHYALTERDRVHLVYETRVEIHGAPASLRPGVPAEVHLLAEAHPERDVAPAEPAR